MDAVKGIQRILGEYWRSRVGGGGSPAAAWDAFIGNVRVGRGCSSMSP